MRVSCALRPSSSSLPTPSPPERTTGRESRLPRRARSDPTSSRRIASTSRPQRDPSGNEPGGGASSLSKVNFRSEERRVGKECRSGGLAYYLYKMTTILDEYDRERSASLIRSVVRCR